LFEKYELDVELSSLNSV